jgi:hypothetical protein
MMYLEFSLPEFPNRPPQRQSFEGDADMCLSYLSGFLSTDVEVTVHKLKVVR